MGFDVRPMLDFYVKLRLGFHVRLRLDFDVIMTLGVEVRPMLGFDVRLMLGFHIRLRLDFDVRLKLGFDFFKLYTLIFNTHDQGSHLKSVRIRTKWVWKLAYASSLAKVVIYKKQS